MAETLKFYISMLQQLSDDARKQLEIYIETQDQLDQVLTTLSQHCAHHPSTPPEHSTVQIVTRNRDHALIISKVKYQPKRLHHAKPCGRPKINISHTKDIHANAAFIDCLQLKALAS